MATTKLVAKIASDLRKPDGLVVVEPGSEAAFLAPLEISRLWGVGQKSAAVLKEYGVRTIGDLAALPDDLLARRFGSMGPVLGQRARGIDADPVSGRDPAKSVGHEHTFDVDTSDPEQIERTLLAMSEGVAGRLRDAGVKATTITVKIRDTTFRTITRQRTLPDADGPDRSDLPDGPRARPAGGPRAPDPAAGRDRERPRRAGAARPVRAPTTRGDGASSRRPTPSVIATATGRSRGRGSSVRGCRRRSSATR